MIGRGLNLGISTTWRARRVWIVPAGLALLWALCRFRNPWDLLLYATFDSEINLILIPLYLFLMLRDLRHPFEMLVVVRLGRTRSWWVSRVLAAGTSAVFLALSLLVMAVGVSLATHGWSWHWGPWSRLKFGPLLLNLGWRVAWRTSLEELGLLALGLWAMGVLLDVLALWWRSPWLAWIVVVGLSFVSFALESTPVVWAVPGVQFSWVLHWGGAGYSFVSPMWTIAYGLALLLAATGTGAALCQRRPWAGGHGGTL